MLNTDIIFGFSVQVSVFSSYARMLPDTRHLLAGAKPQAKTRNLDIISGFISCIRLNGCLSELHNQKNLLTCGFNRVPQRADAFDFNFHDIAGVDLRNPFRCSGDHDISGIQGHAAGYIA